MAAPIYGQMQPTIYRFKFGAFEIATILDGKIVRNGLHPAFGPEHAAEEARALCTANGIEANRYEHPFIPTVVNTGRELVLFDTGNGFLRRDYEQLRGRLDDGHLVERLGPADRGNPVFPRARYVFGAAEFDFWKRGENVREARKFNRELFVRLALPLAERSRFIEPGEELVPGIRAIDAAGHSPGILAYHVESEGKCLLIWADTCVHYVMALQRPDWHLDVDDDKEKAAAARSRILDMASTDKLFVAGFHMPFPGLGTVEKSAGGYRWAPVTYQLNL